MIELWCLECHHVHYYDAHRMLFDSLKERRKRDISRSRQKCKLFDDILRITCVLYNHEHDRILKRSA